MSSFSDIPFVDLSRNHVPSALFANRVSSLLLFYRSQEMFDRLRTCLEANFKIYFPLCDINRVVASSEKKDTVCSMCWA